MIKVLRASWYTELTYQRAVRYDLCQWWGEGLEELGLNEAIMWADGREPTLHGNPNYQGGQKCPLSDPN